MTFYQSFESSDEETDFDDGPELGSVGVADGGIVEPYMFEPEVSDSDEDGGGSDNASEDNEGPDRRNNNDRIML